MKTKNVYSVLRKKFPENAYALMAEVSNGAGMNRSRSADYMIMSLWPSRGLHLHGIELKSSRSDWLSELKNPAKAESIFSYSDKFWLLTNGDNIAKMEEIPEAWGWMEIKGERIFIKKDAPLLPSKEISKSFLAAMLKRASSKEGWVSRSEIQDKLEESKQIGIRSKEREINHIRQNYKDLTSIVSEFEKESGVKLPHRHWSNEAGKIGKAVQFLKNGGADSLEKRLLQLEESATGVLSGIKHGLESIKKED